MQHIAHYHMPEPVRLQIRCSEEQKQEFASAAKSFGMTYGEFAEMAAKFAAENERSFDQFSYGETKRRGGRE